MGGAVAEDKLGDVAASVAWLLVEDLGLSATDLDTLVSTAEIYLQWGEDHRERIPQPPQSGRLGDWDAWKWQMAELIAEHRPPMAADRQDGRCESGPPAPTGPAPQTLVGLYLRALMLGRVHEIDALFAEVERTGSVDLEGMIDAMFHVAVAHMFQPDDHVRVIRRFVAQTRERFGPEAMPTLATEALVRSQLGEPDVYVADLDMEVTIRASLVTIAQIGATLELSEAGEPVGHQRGTPRRAARVSPDTGRLRCS